MGFLFDSLKNASKWCLSQSYEYVRDKALGLLETPLDVISSTRDSIRRTVDRNIILMGNRVDESVARVIKGFRHMLIPDPESIESETLEKIAAAADKAVDDLDRRKLDLPPEYRDEDRDHGLYSPLLELQDGQELQPVPESDKYLKKTLAKLINTELRSGLATLKLRPEGSSLTKDARNRSAIIHDTDPGEEAKLAPISYSIVRADKAPEEESNENVEKYTLEAKKKRKKRFEELSSGEIKIFFDADEQYLLNSDPNLLLQMLLNDPEQGATNKIIFANMRAKNIAIGIDRKGTKIGISIIVSNEEADQADDIEEEEEDLEEFDDINKVWKNKILDEEGGTEDLEIWNLYHGRAPDYGRTPEDEEEGVEKYVPFTNWFSLYSYYVFREQIKELNDKSKFTLSSKAFMPEKRVFSALDERILNLRIDVDVNGEKEHLELREGTPIVTVSKQKSARDASRGVIPTEKLTLDQYFARIKEKETSLSLENPNKQTRDDHPRRDREQESREEMQERQQRESQQRETAERERSEEAERERMAEEERVRAENEL